MHISENDSQKLIKAALVLLLILSVYIFSKFVGEVKSYRFMGKSDTTHTISFNGKGEVQAVPDIASLVFTARAKGKTAKEAEAPVSTQVTKALDFLKDNGVAEKDITNIGYNSYPVYSTNRGAYPLSGSSLPFPAVSEITGYETTQQITVKVRKIDDVGKIIQGITAAGINEISGPDMTIDNIESIQNDARQKAIVDARSKATTLARQLHVSLGQVVDFSESGSGYYPYANEKDMAFGSSARQAAPVIPKGEQTVTSNVTVTYEIQ